MPYSLAEIYVEDYLLQTCLITNLMSALLPAHYYQAGPTIPSLVSRLATLQLVTCVVRQVLLHMRSGCECFFTKLTILSFVTEIRERSSESECPIQWKSVSLVCAVLQCASCRCSLWLHSCREKVEPAVSGEDHHNEVLQVLEEERDKLWAQGKVTILDNNWILSFLISCWHWHMWNPPCHRI